MLDFKNISKWPFLAMEKAITFDTERSVTLEVSGPNACNWYIQEKGQDKPVYFCTTDGVETIRFTCTAGMKIMSDCDTRVSTFDGLRTHIEETGNPSYAKIANRQERNPEIERMVRIQQENFERRMAYLMHEQERRHHAEIHAMGEHYDRRTAEIIDQATADGGAGQEPSGAGEADPGASAQGAGDVSPGLSADQSGGEGSEPTDSA